MDFDESCAVGYAALAPALSRSGVLVSGAATMSISHPFIDIARFERGAWADERRCLAGIAVDTTAQ